MSRVKKLIVYFVLIGCFCASGYKSEQVHEVSSVSGYQNIFTESCCQLKTSTSVWKPMAAQYETLALDASSKQFLFSRVLQILRFYLSLHGNTENICVTSWLEVCLCKRLYTHRYAFWSKVITKNWRQ